jgi:hypothetical protein
MEKRASQKNSMGRVLEGDELRILSKSPWEVAKNFAENDAGEGVVSHVCLSELAFFCFFPTLRNVHFGYSSPEGNGQNMRVLE